MTMADTKRLKKSKKDSKKHDKKRRRHDTDVTSEEELDDSRSHRKKHKKEKKRKFRKPKRKRASSSESSSNYGDMDQILKTPPKHQKMRRIMYRRKIRNIDPDMFISLKKFAYDKEKMIQQAFLTLRRGAIERICPPELSHLTMDELKTKLVTLACTMSKERLRTYADDDDLSHSSDSFEADTPSELSDSDLEVVDDDELVEKLFAEKAKAVEEENDMRERLARRIAEKAFLAKMKSKIPNPQTSEAKETPVENGISKKNGEIEDGEIISDNEISRIPLPLPRSHSPIPINISDDEEEVPSLTPAILENILLPPPPPPPPPPSSSSNSSIILEYDTQPIIPSSNSESTVVRMVSSNANGPVVKVISQTSIAPDLKDQLTSLERQLLAPIDHQEEIDFDDDDDDDGMGSGEADLSK